MADSLMLNDVPETFLRDDGLKMETDNLNSNDNITSTKITISNSNSSSSNDVENVLSPQHKQELLDDIDVIDSLLEKSLTSVQNEDFKVNFDEELKMKTDRLNSGDDIASTRISVLNSNLLSSNDVNNVTNSPFTQHEHELNDKEVDDCILEESNTSNQNEDFKVNVEKLKVKMDNLNSDDNIASTKVKISNSDSLRSNDVENALSSQHKLELTNTEVDDSLLENSKTCEHEDFKVNVEELKMETVNLNFDDNIVSTEISIESNSNDVANSLTPQHEPELNDTEVDNSLLENSKTSGEYENFKVGDIIWAKIGKYPFWPSVICIDPQSKIFIKGTIQ